MTIILANMRGTSITKYQFCRPVLTFDLKNLKPFEVGNMNQCS